MRGEDDVVPLVESMTTLRVVSWNVGLRGLRGVCDPATANKRGAPDTHGVTRNISFGSLKSLLDSLNADIVCLQVRPPHPCFLAHTL